MEKIKEEYEFHKIKYAFNEGAVPPQLNFLMVVNIYLKISYGHVIFLSLNEENTGFVDFFVRTERSKYYDKQQLVHTH